MSTRFRFPIVIIDEDFRSENTSGLGIRALAKFQIWLHGAQARGNIRRLIERVEHG